MRMSQLLSESRILPELTATDKAGVLEELATRLSQHAPPLTTAAILKLLEEREALSSTGIGEGVAAPHGRCAQVQSPVAVLGRSRAGVPFNARDGKPVHLIVALLTPVGENKMHLAALAAITRLLRDAEVRQELMVAEDAEILLKIAAEEPDLP